MTGTGEGHVACQQDLRYAHAGKNHRSLKRSLDDESGRRLLWFQLDGRPRERIEARARIGTHCTAPANSLPMTFLPRRGVVMLRYAIAAALVLSCSPAGP